MTVGENLQFVLQENYNQKFLEEINLTDAVNLYPDELSSGMAQRVSLVRAFLFPSELIMMDEPFVNLDISMRYKLIELFMRMWEKNKKTTLIISHDISDAMMMADRIVIIDSNKIVLDTANDKSEKLKQNIVDTLLKL